MTAEEPKVKKKKTDYVDNNELLKEIAVYRKQYYENKEAGLGRPKMSERLGEMIYLIANNLAKRGNFAGYTYREDMVGDAIENAVHVIHNFDETKSKFAFAYITQIMIFAFTRKITKEKLSAIVKFRVIENMIGRGDVPAHDVDGDFDIRKHLQQTMNDNLDALKIADKKITEKISRKIVKTNPLKEWIEQDSK